MNPAARRGDAGAPVSRSPRLSAGGAFSVVVFNQLRGIEPDPDEARESADGILENHDLLGLSMRRYGEWPDAAYAIL